MSYLNEYEELRLLIQGTGFDETSDYLVNHFLYANDQSRQQSELSRSKIAGVLASVVNDASYGTFLVKYDLNNNLTLENPGRREDTYILDLSDNGAMRIPVGTIGERPSVSKEGAFRINTTDGKLELYINGNWEHVLNATQNTAYVESEINDLSNILHNKINVDISNVIGGAGESLDTLRELELFVTDLSGGTVTNLISKVVDLSAREILHHSQLSAGIITLSSESVRDIRDLSSLTFNTLSTEIADLSGEATREISAVQSLTSYEIQDLSSYTSSELHREITEVSDLITNYTNDKISDISSYTSNELTRQITDLSSIAFETIATKQDIIVDGDITNNLLDNNTVSYGGITLSLGNSDPTPAFDLTDATNYPTSSLTGTVDLTSQVRNVLPVANGGTSWQTNNYGLRYNSNIGIGISPLSGYNIAVDDNTASIYLNSTSTSLSTYSSITMRHQYTGFLVQEDIIHGILEQEIILKFWKIAQRDLL